MTSPTSFLTAYRAGQRAYGHRTASYEVKGRTNNSSTIKPLITTRELEVLHLIAYEHSSKEIGTKLFISTQTANTHRKNIMIKLGVKNTAGMVRVAFERGLLPITVENRDAII